MASYQNKTVCVVDNGLFVELAGRLAQDFGRVLYWCPWESAFPKSNSTLIGRGIPGVTRIDSIWPILDEIDLFVFPDVYLGPLQVYLAKIGKRVWGSRMGEQLELNRVAAKVHMRELGIDIGPFKVVRGLDALREYLRKNPDQYVKVSKTRGDFETFYAKNYSLAEPILDDIEHRLGAKKKVLDFVVEKGIDDAVEVGYDGYTVDGKFPKMSAWGIEVKDKAFILKVQSYASMPARVTDVNAKMAPSLELYKYRGFISSELRLTKDGKAYAIDPCARMGSPPGELFQLIIRNLADIFWNGAKGELVEPDFAAAWGAELLLHSQWADQNWQAVEFPSEIADNVKLRNRTVIEGRNYVVPQSVGLPEVGAVVALGDTMEEAIVECKRIAEKVEGYCIEVHGEAFDEVGEQVEKLRTFGIDFEGGKKEAPQKKVPLGSLKKREMPTLPFAFGSEEEDNPLGAILTGEA